MHVNLPVILPIVSYLYWITNVQILSFPNLNVVGI